MPITRKYAFIITIVFFIFLWCGLVFFHISIPIKIEKRISNVKIGPYKFGSPTQDVSQNNNNNRTSTITDVLNNYKKKKNDGHIASSFEHIMVDLPSQTNNYSQSISNVSKPAEKQSEGKDGDQQEDYLNEHHSNVSITKENTSASSKHNRSNTSKNDVSDIYGTGSDNEQAMPYQIEWSGSVHRTLLSKELPQPNHDMNIVIVLRIEVVPDGSIKTIQPLRKMSPNMEREILKTIKKWQFSELPKDIPQLPQWGTVIFRFVIE